MQERREYPKTASPLWGDRTTTVDDQQAANQSGDVWEDG